ncbi:hypothetical protein QQP08_022335 [Theobroma cacao]|nr:hypothetical protein QQP08_022335 [Theobroma cacao]
MEGESKPSDELSKILRFRHLPIPNSNAVFIDPVRVFNRSYFRFKEARPLLLKAHELLLGAADFPAIMSKLRSEFCSSTDLCGGEEHSFIELGRVWQAPLYDITLDFKHSRLTNESENGGLVR